MKEIDILRLCKNAFSDLCVMDYEQSREKVYLSGQLIFPMTNHFENTIFKDRISEQELRVLFIDQFKENYKKFFYSIETPTNKKYFFGKILEKFELTGQSASIDMCIFKRDSDKFERILNVEFKSQNVKIEHVAKDILKLIVEPRDGVLIHLLHRTNRGTFRNENETGVFDKYYKSFNMFQHYWKDEKLIHLIVLSLDEKILIHREIKKDDLNNINGIFFKEISCGNIKEIRGNGWTSATIV